MGNIKRNQFLLIFSLFYILCFVGAWYLSYSIYPVSIDSDKFLGISFGTSLAFNWLLFSQLSIGLLISAMINIWGILKWKEIDTRSLLLAILMLTSIIFYILGLNLPLVSTTKFWFFEDESSLIQILGTLYQSNEFLLFILMFFFALIVPIIKNIALTYQIVIDVPNSFSKLISLISKWAMLDVLVIGIIVSTFKSKIGYISISTKGGLYYFTASVLISLIVGTCLYFMKKKVKFDT